MVHIRAIVLEQGQPAPPSLDDGTLMIPVAPCPRCLGTGRIGGTGCFACDPEGYVPEGSCNEEC